MIKIPASDAANAMLAALMCRKGKQELVRTFALHPWTPEEVALQAGYEKERAA